MRAHTTAYRAMCATRVTRVSSNCVHELFCGEGIAERNGAINARILFLNLKIANDRYITVGERGEERKRERVRTHEGRRDVCGIRDDVCNLRFRNTLLAARRILCLSLSLLLFLALGAYELLARIKIGLCRGP